MTSEEWAELLTEIMEQVARLEAGLVAMKFEMGRLEADGMYPAIPTGEVWEKGKRYLRLTFPCGTLLGGRRKLYVGCDPVKIQEARKKAANRRRWEELDDEIERLERYLWMTRGNLERVAGSAKRYKLPEGIPLLVARELGTGDHSLSRPDVPKEEWVLTGAPGVEYNLGEELATCTCGMGDGSMPELHADTCVLFVYQGL